LIREDGGSVPPVGTKALMCNKYEAATWATPGAVVTNLDVWAAEDLTLAHSGSMKHSLILEGLFQVTNFNHMKGRFTMADTIYECTKDIVVYIYNPNTKDPIEVIKGTRWTLTMIESVVSFQRLICNGIEIALPDELVERHFKKIK
jgi:hypothetical protein